MGDLNHYGRMRLEYLQTCQPQQLERLNRTGLLVKHLLATQRSTRWEWDQLVSGGVDEDVAETFVIREYIRNSERV